MLARFGTAGSGPRSLLVWPATLLVADEGVVTVHTVTPDLPGECRWETQVLAQDGAAPPPAVVEAPAGEADPASDTARFQRLAWERFAATHGIET